jgi:hypothetical protein
MCVVNIKKDLWGEGGVYGLGGKPGGIGTTGLSLAYMGVLYKNGSFGNSTVQDFGGETGGRESAGET